MNKWGIVAAIEESDDSVGCFDPERVLARLVATFGEDVEFDSNDSAFERFENSVREALGLGIGPDSPAIRTLQRNAVESGPRFKFRFRVPGVLVQGSVNHHQIQVICWSEGERPTALLDRITAFLESLHLGRVCIRP